MAEKKPVHLVPLAELISAQKSGPLQVYQGYWWAVTPNGEAVFFGKDQRYPIANRHQSIAERFLSYAPEGSQVEFVPWAYVKFEISDYT